MSGAHSESWDRLGDGKLLTEDADVGLGHIVSVTTYNWVFFTLLVLTAATVWAAFQDFGVLNLAIALGIATAKAGAVTLFFMHLNFENKIFWGIVIYPLFIFVLILLGTLGDSAVTRPPVPRNAAVSAAPAIAPSAASHEPEHGH